MIATWIVDVLKSAYRKARVDKVLIRLNEGVPLVVFRHGDWARPEVLDSIVCFVSFALQNTGVIAVGLLNFSDDNSLQFSSRGLKIEVRLPLSVQTGAKWSEFLTW